MKRQKISARVYLIVFLSVCILMLIQGFLYRATVESINTQQEQIATYAMKKLNSSFNSMVSTLYRMEGKIIPVENVGNVLMKKNNWFVERNKLNKIVSSYSTFFDIPLYFCVFSGDESYRISTALTDDEYKKISEIYQEYLESDKTSLPCTFHFFMVHSNAYDEIYIACYSPVYNWYYENATSLKRIGTAVLCSKLNPKSLLLSEKALQNTSISLMKNRSEDELQLVEYSLNSKTATPIRIILQTISPLDTEWKIKCTFFSNHSLQRLSTMRSMILTDIAVILLMIVWLSLEFKRSVTAPLKCLTRYMSEYQLEGNQTPLVIKNNVEFGIIADQVNDLLAKNKASVQQLLGMQSELYEARLEKVSLELQSLQRQINPHFLYNTLDCMHSIAIVDHVPEIEKIAFSLSYVMRYASKGKLIVTLGEEIAVLWEYLNIMNIRFPNQYEYAFSVDPSVEECTVPKMTLQPIFKNIFKYATSSGQRQIRIEMSAKKTDGDILIIIQDNGCGIDSKTVEQTNRWLSEEVVPDEHVGLYNVNRRIKLHCGKKYGLSVKSQKNVFTRVDILISSKKNDE